MNRDKNMPVVYKLKDCCQIIAGQSPESKYYNTNGEGLPFFQGKADFGALYPKVRMYCSQRSTIPEKEDILSHVDEYSDRILDFFPTANQVFQKVMDEDITIVPGVQVDDVLNYLRFYLSPSFMITLIVLLIISLLVLALLNKGKRCYYYQRFFFIYAFIWIIGEILLNTIIKEKLMNRLSSANAFINYMINEISKNIWLIILVALLISFIISRINRKEKKNEKILTELCQEDGGEITEKTDY